MSVNPRPGSPYLWYDFTIRGRRFRGSTGQTTRREAREVEREERRRLEAEMDRPNAWTLGMVFGTYWEARASRQSSARNTEYQIENILRICGSTLSLHALDNPTVAKFVAVRRGEGVADSSVNRELDIFKAALNFAAEAHDQPAPRINWRVHRLRVENRRDRFLSQEEFNRLMGVAHDQLRPIILFAVMTGLRKDNILTLTWSQVDLERATARVIMKGNRRHVVELNASALQLLRSMARAQGYIFDRTNFRKRWDAARAAAKLEDFRFHDLRHTFASWARIAGADLADIQDALGHTNLNMTKRYAHIKPGDRESAFDRVAARSTSQLSLKSLKGKA